MQSDLPFKIKPGIYDVYNESHIEVLMSVRDKVTGADFVLCKKWSCMRSSDYFLVSKDEFLSEVTDKRGNVRRKYRFEPYTEESDGQLEDIVEDGFEFVQERIARRKAKRDARDERYLRKRSPRRSETYYDYAKDLLENRVGDIARVKLCQQRKEFIGISKENFLAIRDDQHFVALCFEGALAPFTDLFNELYGTDALTVRGYAEKHGINRGSVEYRKYKMFTTLANELERRDNADGVIRLQKPPSILQEDETDPDECSDVEITPEDIVSNLMMSVLSEGKSTDEIDEAIHDNDLYKTVDESENEALQYAFQLLSYYAGGDDDVSVSEWHKAIKDLKK